MTSTQVFRLLERCLVEKESFWLWGPPGSGKTRLLEQLQRECCPDAVPEVITFHQNSHFQSNRIQLWAHLGLEPMDSIDGPYQLFWRHWCRAYSEQARPAWLIIDRWEALSAPEDWIHSPGPLAFPGVPLGIISRSHPVTYMALHHLKDLLILEPPPLNEQARLEILDRFFASRKVPAPREEIWPSELLTKASASSLFACAQHIYCSAEEKSDFSQSSRARLDLLEVWKRAATDPLHLLPPSARPAVFLLSFCPAGQVSASLLWEVFDREDHLAAILSGVLQERPHQVQLIEELHYHGVDPSTLEVDYQRKGLELLAVLHEDSPRLETLVNLLDFTARVAELHPQTNDLLRGLKKYLNLVDRDFDLLHDYVAYDQALEAYNRLPQRLLSMDPISRYRRAQLHLLKGDQQWALPRLEALQKMRGTRAGHKASISLHLFEGFSGQIDLAIKGLRALANQEAFRGTRLELQTLFPLIIFQLRQGMFRDCLDEISRGMKVARLLNDDRMLYRFLRFQGIATAHGTSFEAGVDLVEQSIAGFENLGLHRDQAVSMHSLGALLHSHVKYDFQRKAQNLGIAAKAIYDRIGDEKNSRMAELLIYNCGVALGESPSPPQWLYSTSLAHQWDLFEAEQSFVKGLEHYRLEEYQHCVDQLWQSFQLFAANENKSLAMRLFPALLESLLKVGDPYQATIYLQELLVYQDADQLRPAIRKRLDRLFLLSGTPYLPEQKLIMDTSLLPGPFIRAPLCDAHDPWCEQWNCFWDQLLRGDPRDSDQLQELVSHPFAGLINAWKLFHNGDVRGSTLQLQRLEAMPSGSFYEFIQLLLGHLLDDGKEPSNLHQLPCYWYELPTQYSLDGLRYWEELPARISPSSLGTTLLSEGLEYWVPKLKVLVADQGLILFTETGTVYTPKGTHQYRPETLKFKVLTFLAAREESSPCSPQELFDALWEQPFQHPSSINRIYTTIANIRHDLDDEDGRLLRSLRGEGYYLAGPAVLI